MKQFQNNMGYILRWRTCWNKRKFIGFNMGERTGYTIETKMPFFHGIASTRWKRNFTKRLIGDTGTQVEDHDQIQKLAVEYFMSLFTSKSQFPDEEVIGKVKPRVNQMMNDMLTAAHTRDEVKKALFSIGDFKAPGPDGLHAVFYKRFWHIIGDDLIDEVLFAVNSKKIPDG